MTFWGLVAKNKLPGESGQPGHQRQFGGIVEGSRAGVSQLLGIVWGHQGALLGRFSLCSAPGSWLKSVLGELP